MSTEELPLSERAFNSAAMMYESDHRGPPPEPEDFAHLDAAPVAVVPAEPVPVPAAEPPAPGWDLAAFDALPAETRAAVQAGTARGLGRSVLEIEAEAELLRPGDVHLHITDPSKYVDAQGRVDRAAIRADIGALTRQRPELSRYGSGPGQLGARPDERRHAEQGGPVGAQRGPMSTLADRVAAASAAMRAGT